MYLYESHLGGYYIEKEYIECEICQQCGDSDDFLFQFDNPGELNYGLLTNGIDLRTTTSILKELERITDIKPYLECIINIEKKK